jgi:hypothetical protein
MFNHSESFRTIHTVWVIHTWLCLKTDEKSSCSQRMERRTCLLTKSPSGYREPVDGQEGSAEKKVLRCTEHWSVGHLFWFIFQKHPNPRKGVNLVHCGSMIIDLSLTGQATSTSFTFFISKWQQKRITQWVTTATRIQLNLWKLATWKSSDECWIVTPAGVVWSRSCNMLLSWKYLESTKQGYTVPHCTPRNLWFPLGNWVYPTTSNLGIASSRAVSVENVDWSLGHQRLQCAILRTLISGRTTSSLSWQFFVGEVSLYIHSIYSLGILRSNKHTVGVPTKNSNFPWSCGVVARPTPPQWWSLGCVLHCYTTAGYCW